jgi:hypothetical protein
MRLIDAVNAEDPDGPAETFELQRADLCTDRHWLGCVEDAL